MKIQKISMLLKILILFILMNNISSASAVPFNENRTITVMSRNLYIGTDLGQMINAQNQTALSEAIIKSFAKVQATDFSTRAQALATEIASKKPDIIGLQEAVLIRSQYPADFSPIPNATTIEFDFLQILLDELTNRGQNYEAVVVSTGFDLEVPGLLPDGSCCQDFRLTDREVILARNDPEMSDLKLSNIQERNFNNNLIVSILGHQFTVLRGWASVDVEAQGKSFRFITTHLEPTYSVVQVAQANELLQGPANTNFSILLVCDCNSNANGTGTDTYGNLITAGFVDAWSQTHPGNPGFTCCQDGNLLNSNSNLSERIDLVLFRGSLNAIESDIVGANTVDRVLSPSGLLLWPSDHAGIVAKLSFSLRNAIKLTAFPQETQVSDIAGATRSFNITANQIVDVTWYINGTEVFNQTNVTESSYTNTSAALGMWNVSALAQNTDGIDMRTWIWNVKQPIIRNGSISGFKINDANGNGKWDSSEAGIQGWNITLKNATTGSLIVSNLTDANGFYQFMNLVNGSYNVTEEMRIGFTPTNATFNLVDIAGLNVMKMNFTNQPMIQPVGGLINPGFENGTANWTFYTNVSGTFTANSPGHEGTKAAKITFNSVGTNIQLYQTGISLEPNTRYRLNFSAYSTTGHDLSVILHKHGSPYTNYGLSYTANLGTSWQSFMTEFDTTGFAGVVTDGRLRFWLAPFAGTRDTYYIDNVRLEKVTGTYISTPTTNNIRSPGFEFDTTSWNFYTNGTGTFTIGSPAFEGSNSANIFLNSGGTNIQLYQTGISLKQNTRYRLNFSAYSTTGHDLSVILHKHGSPYTNYGLSYTANLGTSWQSFTTEFDTTGFTNGVSDGRLRFWLAPFAAAGDRYYIDNVRLEKI